MIRRCRQLSVVQMSTYQHLCRMDIKKVFGKRVKEFRVKQSLSQEELAHRADIDRTYIPSIEKGERNVSIVVAEKIAKALKVDISDLLK